MNVDEALEELKRNAGSQFDPAIVEVFCEQIALRPSPAASGRTVSGETPRGSDRPAHAATAESRMTGSVGCGNVHRDRFSDAVRWTSASSQPSARM